MNNTKFKSMHYSNDKCGDYGTIYIFTQTNNYAYNS